MSFLEGVELIGIAVIAALIGYYVFGIGRTDSSRSVSNKAGDMIIKAGDGGSAGNGGNVYLGPGVYKAGDATQNGELPH